MLKQGLSSEDIPALRAEYGLNIIPAPPLPGAVLLFARQFLSPFIYILLLAAIVSFLLGQTASGVFIVIVLLINAMIGTIQEYSAQKAAAALRNMVKGKARVIRDGAAQMVDIESLLPGDLVLLASGDKVPADLMLSHSQNLSIDESMLTGESVAVNKSADAEIPEDTPMADRINAAFAGTIVNTGRGQGIVQSIGLNTEIGRIARDVNKERESEPPLMIRIRRFTYQVAGGIMLAIVALILLMLWDGSYALEAMLLMAIGLAVSTIPEGLPAALTVALAIGMRRMARHNVIIRKLIAVEALGSCTFICSDKTGTLTVNEMTIRRIVLPDGKTYEISGEGVAPGGGVSSEHGLEPAKLLCTAGVLANEAHLDYAGKEWSSEGDIVDVAFLVLAKKLGISVTALRENNPCKVLIPYESERAFSGSLNHAAGKTRLYIKGSPEKMMQMCSRMLTEDGPVPIDIDLLTGQFESLAAQGYRLLSLGMRTVADDSQAEEVLHDVTFLGIVAMIDPLRPEAHEAVERCRSGGIEVAMITGDHPATAKAISVDLGLCDQNDTVVSGPMLNEMTAKGPEAARELILSARVFARIEPQQKEQIVATLRESGHFVAVTGDGVNDAPAMRSANAGIAMGKRGTDVARESADLIITDDNFASIVDGIEEGRIVYNNIRKVIALLVATGFSAILLFFLAVLAGLPMPLSAVQLLWLNLVANGLQDVALAFEPKEGGELDKQPRAPNEPIFERRIIEHVLLTGAVMGGLAFIVFWTLHQMNTEIDAARNLTLMLMVLFGNFHALNSRSETRSLFQIRFFANPFLILAVPLAQLIHIGAMYTPGLSDVLALQPITLQQWGILLGVACSLVVVEELHKLWHRRKEKVIKS
ncbi:MAG: HAD-IC family P-type ATPase [Thiotrichales bacterium]|nr:HAD-IC family P-type ATPase [Thiotrichales bacterium]